MTFIKDALPAVQVFDIVDSKQEHTEIRGLIVGVGFSESELIHNEGWMAQSKSTVWYSGCWEIYSCP